MLGARSMGFSCFALIYIAFLCGVKADFENKENVFVKSTPGDCNNFFTFCRESCVKGFSAKCATSTDRFGKRDFSKDGCSCLCKGDSNIIPNIVQTTTTTTTTKSTISSFLQTLLQSHNYYRGLHGVPPLTLSQDLNNKAQEWAENLARTGIMAHRQNSDSGENLFMASDSRGAPNGDNAVKAWYDEIKDWNFNNASKKFSGAVTGHFTQVVWKSTSKLGCGRAFNGNTVYVVCNYLAAGNWAGEYGQNVLKPLIE